MLTVATTVDDDDEEKEGLITAYITRKSKFMCCLASENRHDQPPHDETATSTLGLLSIPPVHRPNGLVRSGCPTKTLRAFLPKKVSF